MVVYQKEFVMDIVAFDLSFIAIHILNWSCRTDYRSSDQTLLWYVTLCKNNDLIVQEETKQCSDILQSKFSLLVSYMTMFSPSYQSLIRRVFGDN